MARLLLGCCRGSCPSWGVSGFHSCACRTPKTNSGATASSCHPNQARTCSCLAGGMLVAGWTGLRQQTPLPRACPALNPQLCSRIKGGCSCTMLQTGARAKPTYLAQTPLCSWALPSIPCNRSSSSQWGTGASRQKAAGSIQHQPIMLCCPVCKCVPARPGCSATAAGRRLHRT